MIDPTARAWAYLSRVAEPPCAQLAALVRCVGPVEAADRVRRGQVGNELAQHTGARREIDRAADDLELLMRRGGRLITPDDDEWPVLAFAAFSGAGARARPCGHSPLVLWALGPARLDEVAPRAAAVVGTRAATPTASMSRPIWPPGWQSATSRSSPVAPTGSTVRLTARRWIPRASPWPYWPADLTSRIRRAIRRCYIALPNMGCCSPNTRPVSVRPGTGS